MKIVAILGGSYGEARAATILARASTTAGTSFSSTPGSLVSPAYTDPARSVVVHASVASLAKHTLTLERAFPKHGLIYTLGSHLPSPINLWTPATEDTEKAEVLDVARGTKEGRVAFLKQFQRLSRAASILVVGAGAIVIQFVSDVAEIYPAANVALLHSRHRLLPRFDEAMHSDTLNDCTILGERLYLASLADNKHCNGERVVRTQQARSTGGAGGKRPRRSSPAPFLAPLSPMAPTTTSHASGARSRPWSPPMCPNSRPPSMRSLATASTSAGPSSTELSPIDVRSNDASEPATADNASESSSQVQLEAIEDARTRVAAAHIFAIGDAADAFGAVNAGHNTFFQGEAAAWNVIRLIKRAEREERAEAEVASREVVESVGQDWEGEKEEKTDEEDLALEKYTPGARVIKVSLGLTKSVYQCQGIIGTRDQEQAGVDIHMMWRYFGYEGTSTRTVRTRRSRAPYRDRCMRRRRSRRDVGSGESARWGIPGSGVQQVLFHECPSAFTRAGHHTAATAASAIVREVTLASEQLLKRERHGPRKTINERSFAREIPSHTISPLPLWIQISTSTRLLLGGHALATISATRFPNAAAASGSKTASPSDSGFPMRKVKHADSTRANAAPEVSPASLVMSAADALVRATRGYMGKETSSVVRWLNLGSAANVRRKSVKDGNLLSDSSNLVRWVKAERHAAACCA
ncbi:uncharacterized protein BXZ73DRAFT_81691 [Epithele typhae]|uniref:uncharacterized protein n=1 Tax=Epithele typhae TaxID=378194 RepID=UPI0020085A77|nr:uncharacterized protein BXZ73DRAFT_81691 [Epithele typhae]KAH9914397.1 hypothetical protein BXZ73DRAFT_81691 [Epithele typhae]